MGKTAILKKLWEKVVFEIRMQIMDARWRNSMLRSCWEVYPPSFYYRYTPDEQKQIKNRDFARIRVLLEEYEEDKIEDGGIPVKM